MLDGLPLVGWFLSKLKRRPRRPSTHVNVVIYGDVINSNINVNAPSDSELRLQDPSGMDSDDEELPADKSEQE